MVYIGNKDKLKTRSNAKIKPFPADHVAWCNAHAARLVGENPKTHQFYDQCYTGFWKKEPCRIKYGRRDM